ncbi:MAG TPA: carboxylesterase family protein [Pyrinomonadaceae bacterium]
MRSKFVFTVLALCTLSFVAFVFLKATPKPADDLIVNTKSGQLRGVTRRSGGGAEFLGIPFALPPVGDLRWHEPQPVQPWKGIRDASTFGSPCAQAVLGDWNLHDSQTSKEDCLYLNVITPELKPNKPLPVMFWIHGGANAGGTASSALYKDGTLVQHGVLLVTVNYRLGVFGFFAHPELTTESGHHASGNWGLMDQIAALHWVHDNIANFGGDPNNVIVFGQSAGAQDTSLLMASPLTRGLFHKAIVQSGSAIDPRIPSLKDAELNGEKIATKLKVQGSADVIKRLRQLPVGEVINGVGVQDPVAPPLIGPNVDGWVLQNSGAAIFTDGKQAPVPLMIGVTAREFNLDGGVEAARQMITAFTGDLAPRVLALYGLDNGGAGKTDPVYGPPENQWFSDLIFRCSATTQAAWQTASGYPTYQYQLEHAIPGQEAQGAVHSTDLPYVFGYYPRAGNLFGSFNDTDYKLADLIETYWTNFAKTGNPNGSNVPNWPMFGETQAYISFTQDGKVVASKELRKPQCDAFRDVLKLKVGPMKR